MGIKRFLRYNGRHALYFPRGYEGCWLPQLDPIVSCSHGKNHKPTFRFYEPIWAFRLRQRLFCFAGHHRCQGKFSATWDIGPDGNRTCSACGSIHVDDLMEICRKTLADERYGVEGTSKGYKVYVRQPGVRNASEGAIKFYMWHAPAKLLQADQVIFAQARQITHDRFMRQFQARA